jgi:hypothetical protein
MLPPTGVFGKANASEERKPNGARIETNIDYRPARRLNEGRKAERNGILGSSIPIYRPSTGPARSFIDWTLRRSQVLAWQPRFRLSSIVASIE